MVVPLGHKSLWPQTNGVNTSGAAAEVMSFDGLGKKVRPGTFGEIKVGYREYPKSTPVNTKNMKFAVTPLALTPFVPFRSSHITITITIITTTITIITITITATKYYYECCYIITPDCLPGGVPTMPGGGLGPGREREMYIAERSNVL